MATPVITTEVTGNVVDAPSSINPGPTVGLSEPQVASGSALPAPLAAPPSDALPPTYQQAQLDASSCQDDEADGMWISVQCKKVGHLHEARTFRSYIYAPFQESQHNLSKLTSATPAQPQYEPETAPPGLPEFYQALSKFEEAHSDLQGHAKAICKITKSLFDLQRDLAKIHEHWMETGMHDFAHDVLPILDCGKCSSISRLPSSLTLTF